MYEVFREYRFEAAHRLPLLPEGHKCARLHGHSFVVQLIVRGPLDADKGWVVDYYDIDTAWAPCDAQLDHRYLNEIDGLENPTSEAIARWIWERVQPRLPRLARVLVKETCDAGCVYLGPDASP
jgi:6-pyruvoyltetrahydropterin/6-carboxytetrahydropterin synthase